VCERCREQAREKAGEPLPDLEEFLQSVLARAELDLDLELMRHGEMLTNNGAALSRRVIGMAVHALGTRMGEEGIVMVPCWLALLGQDQAVAIAEERESGA
jgi:hypothetical protein